MKTTFTTYSVLFDGLQSQYELKLSNLTQTTFVVSHKAFSYIANEFSLTQLSLNGIDTEGEPDAQTLATIINYINDNNISTVFYQTFVNSKVAEQIAEETNATVDMLSTIEGLTLQQLAAGQDYLSLMAQNLFSTRTRLNYKHLN